MTQPGYQDGFDPTQSEATSVVFDPVALTTLGGRAVKSVELQEPSVLSQIHEAHPEIEVRGYQVECLDALQRVRDEGKTVALVQMATGLGKTTVVASDVKRFMDENPGSRVLFLCHQNEILRQARQRFKHVLGDGRYSFGTFNGKTKAGFDADCVFASFQTMGNWRDRFEPDAFDYIVVDESHHGKAETYEPTLKYFDPKFMLGVTATPDRKDLKDIREIFGEEIYTKSLSEALAEGLLARPDYRVIVDSIENRLPPDERVSLADLNKTFFIPKRDEEIARIIGERLAAVDQPRAIIFCPSIEHSERMQALIEGSKVINSGMGHTEREQVLKAFRNRELNTLITVDLFNEGIDVADANAIIFLRSTQSETIFLQQLGRGLRKMPGKDSVLVLDFVANCDRLIMIERLLRDTVRHYGRAHGGFLASSNQEPAIDLYGISFDDVGTNAAVAQELHLANFDFSESTRQIIELIKDIQNSAPERLQKLGGEVISLTDFASELGVTKAAVIYAAKARGLEVPMYQVGSYRTRVVRVGDQGTIRGALAEFIAAPKATGDIKSVLAFGTSIGVSKDIFLGILEEHGIQPGNYRFAGNLAPGLTKEQQDIVLGLPEILPLPPKGTISINKFAKQKGITYQTMKDAIDASDLTLPKYKFGPKPGEGLDQEAQDKVLALPTIKRLLETPKAPPNIKSARGLARELNVDKRKINRVIVDDLGIDPSTLTTYRFGSMTAKGIDEELEKRIKRLLGKF